MPTLRSQYQHVKADVSKYNSSSMTGSSNMTISPSKGLIGGTISSQDDLKTLNLSPNTHHANLINSKVSNVAQISPNKNIVNVSPSSSDDDKSLASNNSIQRHDNRGNHKKGNRNRKNSRNSNGSRKSSRRSSGSISEDLLNTATVHCTSTTQNEAPLYTSTSLPTLLTQSNNLQFNTTSLAFKRTTDHNFIQALHARIPGFDGYPGLPTLPNMPYIDHQAYIPLLMETRGDMVNMDYQSAHSSQSSLKTETVAEEPVRVNTEEGLQKLLDQNGCFETKDGMLERADIVKSLDLLVKQWIRSCGLEKGLDYTVVESNQGMVLTYGSCKLEAADKDADMDLICIAPSFVGRDDFFSKMYSKLLKHESVRELRKLPDVFVPVMKFKFNNIEIDFTFTRLNRTVPDKEENLLEEMYTRNLDDRCLRSLNGYRATCQILTLVPDVKVFQLSLRAIKLWGRLNGVYGNILGYLGGASWAILVARTCQEQAKRNDVDHCLKEVVFTFFQMYSQWKWPAPVYIRQVIDQPDNAWNPSINPADRDHCMPIITSSVPQMNSAVNISKSIQLYIQERMLEAHFICMAIQNGSAGWEDLFKPFEFYQEYEEFVQITGECETDSCFWFGCLESKLRYLKEKIESSHRIHSVRIWPKGFVRKEKQVNTQIWYIGIAGSGNNLEKHIEEDLLLFKDKCYGDLRRPFGNSAKVQRAFSVNCKIVHRREVVKTLTNKELGKSQPENPVTYASVTQGLIARSATPPLMGIHGQVPALNPQVYTSQAMNLNILSSLYSSQSTNTSSSTVAKTIPSTYVSTSLSSTSFPAAHMIPQPMPYYYEQYLFGTSHERLSPQGVLVQKSRSNSPRPGTSPREYSGRNHSPNLNQRHTNSPSQFIFSENRSGYSSMSNAFVKSPKHTYQRPYSPKHAHDRNFLGPFTFPPPIRPVVTTPPPSIHIQRSAVSSPAKANLPPSIPLSSSVNIGRRTDHLTVVSGVTSINNNLKVAYSCESVSDIEATDAFSKNKPFKKESVNEDDRLRSVSNSSDTVPPNFLFRSRVTHQDAPPPSPFTGPNTSPNNANQSVMIPLSEVDTSVPPPIPVTTATSSSPVKQGPQLTFSSLEGNEKQPTRRAPRSERLSVSELNDAPSPRPVMYKNRHPIDIKVNICQNDDVFKK